MPYQSHLNSPQYNENVAQAAPINWGAAVAAGQQLGNAMVESRLATEATVREMELARARAPFELEEAALRIRAQRTTNQMSEALFPLKLQEMGEQLKRLKREEEEANIRAALGEAQADVRQKVAAAQDAELKLQRTREMQTQTLAAAKELQKLTQSSDWVSYQDSPHVLLQKFAAIKNKFPLADTQKFDALQNEWAAKPRVVTDGGNTYTITNAQYADYTGWRDSLGENHTSPRGYSAFLDTGMRGVIDAEMKQKKARAEALGVSVDTLARTEQANAEATKLQADLKLKTLTLQGEQLKRHTEFTALMQGPPPTEERLIEWGTSPDPTKRLAASAHRLNRLQGELLDTQLTSQMAVVDADLAATEAGVSATIGGQPIGTRYTETGFTLAWSSPSQKADNDVQAEFLARAKTLDALTRGNTTLRTDQLEELGLASAAYRAAALSDDDYVEAKKTLDTRTASLATLLRQKRADYRTAIEKAASTAESAVAGRSFLSGLLFSPASPVDQKNVRTAARDIQMTALTNRINALTTGLSLQYQTLFGTAGTNQSTSVDLGGTLPMSKPGAGKLATP